MDEPVQEVPVKRSRLALLTLIAVILAAGLAALFWVDARQRIGGTQEELARRPQFVPIRRALARDLERVKALPAVDIAGMSARLNSLVAAVDSLPLAFDERSEREPAAKSGPADAERGFWSRLGSEIRSELRSLVVVRQVNPPDPPLLPPTQAYFLRENLRLRLLNARL